MEPFSGDLTDNGSKVTDPEVLVCTELVMETLGEPTITIRSEGRKSPWE
jgi:hypothetical protein